MATTISPDPIANVEQLERRAAQLATVAAEAKQRLADATRAYGTHLGADADQDMIDFCGRERLRAQHEHETATERADAVGEEARRARAGIDPKALARREQARKQAVSDYRKATQTLVSAVKAAVDANMWLREVIDQASQVGATLPHRSLIMPEMVVIKGEGGPAEGLFHDARELGYRP